jgi:Lanthionine synthetase C-like protein
MLFSPEAHEALVDEPWNAERVREGIRRIAEEAEAAFEDGWLMHPADADPAMPNIRYRTVYLGGAGVVDALRRLQERGLVGLGRDYVPYLERSLTEPPDFADQDPCRSLWMGEVGIRLVLQRLSPSSENRDALAELIAANARDERRELMWGSPGTMLAARALGLRDLWDESADWLRDQRGEDGLWEQHLYGERRRFLGPAHGWAGCAMALGEGDGVAEVARRFAVERDGLANWPPLAGEDLAASNRDGQIRTQWCHGAPGIVASLARFLDEELALAGAELTWRAGPLAKGANLCHGTAGNGYALLAVLERTGDELWLARARAFAMHALGQVEQGREAHGRGRHTLWTGDPGTALYLADCLDGRGELPLP